MISIFLGLNYCCPWKDKTSPSSRNQAELKLKSDIASFSQPARTIGLLPRFLLDKKRHPHPLTSVGEPSSFKKASVLRTLPASLVTLKGIDHIYQNKWQLTLQGRPARPWESAGKKSLAAHSQLESFPPRLGFCPSQISELTSSRSALQPEPIAKDLAKPSPAEGTVSELFVSLRQRSLSLFSLLYSPVFDGAISQKQFRVTGKTKYTQSSQQRKNDQIPSARLPASALFARLHRRVSPEAFYS